MPRLVRRFILYVPVLLALAAVAGCDSTQPIELNPPDVVEVDQDPAWSPDGDRIAYLHDARGTEDTTDVTGLYILNLQADTTHLVVEGFTMNPDWQPDGERIAFSTGDIFTIRSDGSDFHQVTSFGSSFFPSWSPNGKRLAFDTSYRDESGANVIWLVDPNGSNLEDISQHGVGEWRNPGWSPEGSEIVHLRFLDDVSGEEVFVMDSTGVNATRLTTNERNDRDPTWSPNGKWIAWVALPKRGGSEVWIMRADGSAPRKLIMGGATPTWGPNSERIVFARASQESDYTALWMIRRDGTGLRQLTFPASSNK